MKYEMVVQPHQVLTPDDIHERWGGMPTKSIRLATYFELRTMGETMYEVAREMKISMGTAKTYERWYEHEALPYARTL